MYLEHAHPPHHKQCEHDSISRRSVRFLRHEEDFRNSPRGISGTRLSSAARLPERELSHLCPFYQLRSQADVNPHRAGCRTEVLFTGKTCHRETISSAAVSSASSERRYPASKPGLCSWKAGLPHFQRHSPPLNAGANVSSKLPPKCCSTTCFIGTNESHSKN